MTQHQLELKNHKILTNIHHISYNLVDGRWGPWQKWGPCSATCNDGTQTRVRYCDSPTPQGTGLPCSGDDTSARACVVGVCGQPSKVLSLDRGCNLIINLHLSNIFRIFSYTALLSRFIYIYFCLLERVRKKRNNCSINDLHL